MVVEQQQAGGSSRPPTLDTNTPTKVINLGLFGTGLPRMSKPLIWL